jgi:hypothetical protein
MDVTTLTPLPKKGVFRGNSKQTQAENGYLEHESYPNGLHTIM